MDILLRAVLIGIGATIGNGPLGITAKTLF